MMSNGYDLTGQNVQGYTIKKPIGQGKFSIVYLAEKDGVAYALKKIKIFDMGDQKQRQKCLKEVDLMKPLDHPNIIKYIDSFIHNNQLIIITEWADKGDLKKHIKEHESEELPFDEPTIWDYMRQISSALKHMHEKRIMHRDLKPANIFISHDSSLKIGDLGLGRIFGSETLEAYSKVGTPLYMSPQLIKDTGYNMNADVWSLGCICYELAELTSPFRNKQEKMGLMDLFDNITRCNYKPINSKYSPELSRVIKDMIVVDPNQRLSSDQVYQIALYNIQNIKKPKIDPIITMDDIGIKLNLLNYTNMFCKAAERKPIHKFYFAIQDNNCPQYDQLYYFLELAYWVMGLAKGDNRKDKLPLYTKTQIDWKSPDNACRKLFVDINAIGIQFEDIDVESVRHGYGESICYLLNQILNRQLIRSNFQFGEPKGTLNKNQNQYIINVDQPEEELQNNPHQISSESLEEQSQFEQSIFYRKNKKDKIHSDNVKILEKIQEFQDDDQRNMIIGKVEEKEWKLQCIRVQKNLNDLTQNAKEARKKIGYQNFETSKICASKLADLTKYLKSPTMLIASNIERDLQIIQKGQKKINEQYKGLNMQYKNTNTQFNELQVRSSTLRDIIRNKQLQYQKLQQKSLQVQDKIKIASKQSQSNNIAQIKYSIEYIKKQLRTMDQKLGIMSWQLQKKKIKLLRGDYLIDNQIDQ